MAISTSGNRKKVLNAAVVAKALGMKVPETETYKIQELHLPIYH